MQNFGVMGIQKIVLSMVMLFTMAYSSGVEAILSSTEIVQGNMAQLKLKASGDSAEFPNIKEINGMPILGRHESQNNSYSYINGKMSNERSITLVLTFAPQKDMTIPSYEVKVDGKVYKTKPLQLKVRKATSPQMAGNGKFSLQMRANKKEVMVGESFLVSVYFSIKQGVRLSDNPDYSKPEFKGFFVKELADQKTYMQGDRQVTELRYILTAQTEGNFTIGPARAKIAVADRSRRDMFGRFFGSTWVPIASNMIDIHVVAKPVDSDLLGDFKIESSIDAQKVKANKPVNFSVEISGKGSLEDFEFPLYEIDGVTVYSDDAKITSSVYGDDIQSKYTKKFVFISDKDFDIPERTISVYDSTTKSVKKLVVPAYHVRIEGGSAAAVPVEKKITAPKETVGQVQTNLKIPERSMLDDGEPEVAVETNATEWWMVILAFISGMVVMFLTRYLPRSKARDHRGHYSEAEALKILYSHMSESPEIEAMVRKLYAKKNGDKSIIIDKKALNEMLGKVQS